MKLLQRADRPPAGFPVMDPRAAHTVRDPLGRTYNRTTHLPERWADYLDGLKNGAEVVPLRFAGPA